MSIQFSTQQNNKRQSMNNPYTREKLGNMTLEYKRHLLNYFYNNSIADKFGDVKSTYDLHDRYVDNAIASFSDADLNEAHYKLWEQFRANGGRIYIKGRPQGARNRRPTKNTTYRNPDYTPRQSNEIDNLINELVDVLPDEGDVIEAQSTPLIEATPNTSTSNNTDLSDYVRKQQMIDAITASAKAIQETLEPIYTRHDHAISGLNNDVLGLQAKHAVIAREVEELRNARPLLIQLPNVELAPIELPPQHKNFQKLLKACSAKMRNGQRLNVWIYGPAGTGKSTAGENVAKALGLQFYTNGKLNSEHKIEGYQDAHSHYNSTEFRRAYENGGVYLADEIDGSYPDALLAFNSALANGFMTFPDKQIRRHPDFIFIGAANTTGQGATTEYVGRFQQDAAFNDRFVYIDWPIDDALEDNLCANKEWLALVRKVRAGVNKTNTKNHLITPRAAIYGEALIAAGFTMDEAAEMTLKKGLSAAQWGLIRYAN